MLPNNLCSYVYILARSISRRGSNHINYTWEVNRHYSHICNSHWRQIAGALKQIDASDMEVWGIKSASYWNKIFNKKLLVDDTETWTCTASGNGRMGAVNSSDIVHKRVQETLWCMEVDTCCQ